MPNIDSSLFRFDMLNKYGRHSWCLDANQEIKKIHAIDGFSWLVCVGISKNTISLFIGSINFHVNSYVFNKA